jgi:hypothetical protein
MVRIYTEPGVFIDREMNDDEFAQWEKDVEKGKAEQAEIDARAQAKADLLAKLGITADEAKLLLG